MSEINSHRFKNKKNIAALLSGTVLLALALFGSAQAADKAVVTWSITNLSIKGKPGETIQLKLKAEIPADWHTYSTTKYKDDAGPFSTLITLTPETAAKIDGAITATDVKSEKTEAWDFPIETVEGTSTFTVPVKIAADAKPGDVDVTLAVKSQLCNAKTCLLPKESKVPFKITVVDPTKKELVPVVGDITGSANGNGSSNVGAKQVIEDAKKAGLFTYILLAMGAGFAALLTPCVFPMIPITVSFFTKRMHATRVKSVLDASIFSTGIVGTFTGLAFPLAIIFGAASLSHLVANRWFNIAFALIIIAFAMNLFGVFEIQVPSFILNRLNKSSSKGDSFVSVFLMGSLFALTSFTCTGPFVGQILVSAANGDWKWPLLGMLAFSSAFAIPFFFLALFPSVLKSLPKSGGWLNSVKVVMGFVEIAFAMKYLSSADVLFKWNIFNRDVCLSIWVAVAALTTAYLLGWFQLTHDTPVEKVGGVRVMFASSFLAVGVFVATGLTGRNLGVLDSLIANNGEADTIVVAPSAGNGGNCPPSAVMEEPNKPKDLVWLKDFDEARAESKRTGKPLFVDFTGVTCQNCNRMEKSVFPKPEVAALLSNYVLVRLYTDDGAKAAENADLMDKRFNSASLPTYAIVSPEDKNLNQFEGYAEKTEEFVAFLNSGVNASGAKPVAKN